MSDTVRAGTLRAPQTPAEYLSRDNEWCHRWFLRQALAALTAEYRALFEKAEQERAKALAAYGQDLARAHERITDLERALAFYDATRWESRLQLRWARIKLRIRGWLGARDVATAEAPAYPEPSCTDPRD